MLKFWRRKNKNNNEEERPNLQKTDTQDKPITDAEKLGDVSVSGKSAPDIPPPMPETPQAVQTDENTPDDQAWTKRLASGLSKSSTKLTGGLTDIFTKRKLDDEALEELEELLILSDMGPATAAQLSATIAKKRFGKDITVDEVKEYLAKEISEILKPVAKPLLIDEGIKPAIILVVGVNGTGKTTTIAKLAQEYQKAGKSVVLAAGDTFRAAAVEQLQIWATRTGAHFVGKEIGADAAAVAFEAIDIAKTRQADVVIIDTAGRLHNKSNLMDELAKIYRVIQKQDQDAPHATLITLDATTGQNAVNQVETFNKITPLSGLIVTKLDGSAKGGVVVSLAQKYTIPIHAVGVGEGADDLQAFDANEFAKALIR